MAESPDHESCAREIFDSALLMKTLEGDEELCREIISIFINTALDRIDTIEAALAADDLSEAGRFAHSMKGACATIQAEKARKKSEQLDFACRGGCRSEAELVLAELRSEVEELLNHLISSENAGL
jgi:HPt (histidine-containing phosphotransfer) domain-containing protein